MISSCMVSMTLVLFRVDIIPGDGYMIDEQNCVTLLQGSKMPPGLHSNNLKSDILCFRIITSNK